MKPLLSGHLRDLPKCLLNRGFKNCTMIVNDKHLTVTLYQTSCFGTWLSVCLIGGPLNRGLTVKYYSYCYYKLWQYYPKYAYHADKLSHSHSCLLERELALMLTAGGRGGGACPHPLSLPPPQPCFSTQNWSSGNVKILLNTSCSIQGARFLPSDDSRIAQ